MNLYLDDDTAAGLLVKLLVAAGHDVTTPIQLGHGGEDDATHLRHAIEAGRIMVTHNHRDYIQLHRLILAARGRHHGIIVIRKDNDKRDMSSPAIVSAIGRIVTLGTEVADQYVFANDYR